MNGDLKGISIHKMKKFEKRYFEQPTVKYNCKLWDSCKLKLTSSGCLPGCVKRVPERNDEIMENKRKD